MRRARSESDLQKIENLFVRGAISVISLMAGEKPQSAGEKGGWEGTRRAGEGKTGREGDGKLGTVISIRGSKASMGWKSARGRRGPLHGFDESKVSELGPRGGYQKPHESATPLQRKLMEIHARSDVSRGNPTFPLTSAAMIRGS